MANRKFGYIVLAMLFLGFSAGAYGQVTVSGGLALSSMTAESSYGSESVEGDIGIGGNIYIDYLLPISVPLSLGAEVGVDSSKFTTDNSEDTVLAIPLLLRVAYHFDLFPKLDLYLVGKIGYALGKWSGDTKKLWESYGGTMEEVGGFAFGVDIGAAYYFTSTIGLFAEAGLDRYGLSAKATIYNESETLKVPFSRFFTAGLSAKF
ncbi:MAG: porin family protein [Treponema sp.]|jgi:hypothetical protein|nr:porin family protein [Treponema sp.]